MHPFEYIRTKGILWFHLHEKLSTEVAAILIPEIQSAVAAAAGSGVQAVAIDLKRFDIDHRTFRTLAPLGTELKKTGVKLYLVTPDQSVYSLMQSQGVDSLLCAVDSAQDLAKLLPGCAEEAPAKPKIDVAFINPFIQGTINTLTIQCQVSVTAERPMLKKSGTEFRTDIAGIIGIASATFSGSIAICFPEATFLYIMTRMLGEPCLEINKDLEDGAAEILNMIFGHGKKVLNEQGHAFEKALPSIVRAPGLSLSHVNAQGSILLPFRTDGGTFHMEISTKSTRD